MAHTPLHSAVNLAEPAAVEALLTAGVDILEADDAGFSALRRSVINARGWERSKKGEGAARLRIRDALLAHARRLPAERLSLADAVTTGHSAAFERALPGAGSEALTEALWRAIEIDDAASLARLLQQGADPDAFVGDVKLRGGTERAIALAASSGHLASLKALVTAGAHIDAAQPRERGWRERAAGSTALMHAAAAKRLHCVKALLDAGADPMIDDALGANALAYARKGGSKRIIALLERAVDESAGATLSLHEAARLGLKDRIAKLVAEGVAVDSLNAQGRTALFEAAIAGQVEAARALCEAGAVPEDARIGEHSLWNFLLAPTQTPTPELLGILLEHGLDPNERSERFGTPVVRAMWLTRGDELARVLVQHGADLDAIVPRPLVERRIAQGAQGMLFQRRREARRETATIDPAVPMNVLEYARMFAPEERYRALLSATELGDTEAGLYEALRSRLKECAALSESEAFRAEVERISAALGAKAQSWKRRKGVTVFFVSRRRLNADEGHPSLPRLQDEAGERGYTLAYTGLSTQAALQLVLFPVSDSLIALAACGTNGANYGLDTRDIVTWCERMRADQALRVAGAGFDFMEFAFALPLHDAFAIARSAAELCPDLQVNPGDAGAVERMAGDLSRTGRLFFWWD